MNALCCCKDPTVKEIWRLRLNWLFLILSSILVSTNISSVTSFHQFVTNPTSDKINTTVSKLEPGLGLTEQLYSATITLFYTGEFIGAVVAGFLIQIVPYWYIALTSLLIYTLSCVMYALTTMGWLLILSRLLSGGFIGVIITLAPTYFGQTNDMYVTVLKELGKSAKDTNVRVKDLLFALHSFGLGCGFLIGTGMTMIFSLFDISQFRSIAWFNTATGLAFVVLQLVMFQGESKCRKPPQLGQRFYYMIKPRMIWIDVLVVVFLVLAAPAHSLLTVTYMVLFNPILGDSFGFSERQISYAFFVLTAAGIAGALITILLQNLKLSNRIVAIIGVIISIIAFTLLADWQSIPYDSCTEHSLFHHPELINMYKQEIKNASGSLQHIDLMPEHLRNRSTESPVLHWQLIEIVGTEVYDLAASKCEARHLSTGCHWIPISSVTKQNCTDCQPICRSVHKTLNFIQFCIGAMLLLIAHPIISVSMTNLITDVTHKQLHGVVLGIVFASGAVSKIISPLWMDAAYEGTQKRSFLPMSIMLGINLLLLLGFVVLYPKLGKREREDQKTEDKTCELEQ